ARVATRAGGRPRCGAEQRGPGRAGDAHSAGGPERLLGCRTVADRGEWAASAGPGQEAGFVSPLHRTPGVPAIAGVGALAAAAVVGLTLWQVLTAVDRDLFQAARRRPALKFRLPEQVAAPRRTSGTAPDRSGAIRVIGTAVLPDGGFALCQRAGASPTLVRLGGMLGDLTLK